MLIIIISNYQHFLFFCVTVINKIPTQDQSHTGIWSTTALKEDFPGSFWTHLEAKVPNKKAYSLEGLSPVRRSEKSQTIKIMPHNEANSVSKSFYPALHKLQAWEPSSQCARYWARHYSGPSRISHPRSILECRISVPHRKQWQLNVILNACAVNISHLWGHKVTRTCSKLLLMKNIGWLDCLSGLKILMSYYN